MSLVFYVSPVRLASGLLLLSVAYVAMARTEWTDKENASGIRTSGSETAKTGEKRGSIFINSPATAATPGAGCDDVWTATSVTNAPAGRDFHTAVWTGNEMIIWGGRVGSPRGRDGGRYTPGSNSWTATSLSNAPSARSNHTAVWTGSEMIVWGGFTDAGENLNDGGKYNPSTNSWTPLSTVNAPTGRSNHTAIWTGSEMIVWGGFLENIGLGNTGGRYNPTTDTWTPLSVVNAPSARAGFVTVWTGSEMIIWGGRFSPTYFANGARYNPATDTWTAMTMSNAPSARADPGGVWTGSEMILWGGYNGSFLNTGARYNPATNSWIAIDTTNAPVGRVLHATVWTGSEMIIWGGIHGGTPSDGGRYNPATTNWIPTSLVNAPTAVSDFSVVWTGSEMIIWGGSPGANDPLNTGAKYCALSSPAPGSSTLGNISTRLRVETGDNVLIGGFIVTGTQPKKVIVRAMGPSLPLGGVLADPTLELHNSSGLIMSNNNWRSDQETEINATGLQPGNDLESAIVATLPANGSAYTAIVRGLNNGTGVGLVEVYDLDRTVDSKLANISTRGLVQTGDNVLIAGTIVLGVAPQRVVIRAIGPSLPVSGALANPILELRDGNGGLIRSNDDWRTDQEAEIIDTGLSPLNDLESAIVATLPGNGAGTTAIVRGVNNAAGVALVEVYALQ